MGQALYIDPIAHAWRQRRALHTEARWVRCGLSGVAD
jgi:hypothetical protein